MLTAVTPDASWILGNHLQRLAEQGVEQLAVLVLSAASDDPLLAELQASAARHGADLHYGSWMGADADGDGALQVAFSALPAGRKTELKVDMIALYSEVQPDPSTSALAQLLDLQVDERGYLSLARPGVYPIGGVAGVVGIETASEQSLAAVNDALQHTAPETPAAAASGSGATEGGTAGSALRREDLEQLLHALLRLGEGRAP